MDEALVNGRAMRTQRPTRLSHATAAWWWGLIDEQPEAIDVSTRSWVRSRPGVTVHRPADLDATRWRRFPITTVAHTPRDLAATTSERQLRRAVAEADYLGLLDVAAVHRALGPGRPGTSALREALERHHPRLAHTRSELENAFFALCERHAIPLPEVNVMIEGHLVDAVWRDRRVIVELDGYRGHRSRAQLHRDHQRDLRLRSAGFTVLRYTWTQIVTQPQLVAEDLLKALGA